MFARIERDSRHDAVELVNTGVEERVFARWAMANDDKPDIPLIAHVDGIHRAAGRATTADQESVLDVMREAARGGAVTG